MSAQTLAEIDVQIVINYGDDQSTTTNLTTLTCTYEEISYNTFFNLLLYNTYLGVERTDFSMGVLTLYKEEADAQIIEIPEDTTALSIPVVCQYNHGNGNNYQISYVITDGLEWGLNYTAPLDRDDYQVNSNYFLNEITTGFQLYPINILTVTVDAIPIISGSTPYILIYYGGSVEYWETGETLNNFITNTVPYITLENYPESKLTTLSLSNFINLRNLPTQYNYTIFLLSKDDISGVFTNHHYEVVNLYQDASHDIDCTIIESPLGFSIDSTTTLPDQFI